MSRLARTIARDWFYGRISDKDLQYEVATHTASQSTMRNRIITPLTHLGATDSVILKVRRILGDPTLR